MKNIILFTLLLSSFQLWAQSSQYYLLNSSKMKCKPVLEARSLLAAIPQICADRKYYIFAFYAKKDIHIKTEKSSCLIDQGSDLPINDYAQFSVSGQFKEYTNSNQNGKVVSKSSNNAYGHFEINQGVISLKKNILNRYSYGFHIGDDEKSVQNIGYTYYPEKGASVIATNYVNALDVECGEEEDSLISNSAEKAKERAGTFTYPAPERTNAR